MFINLAVKKIALRVVSALAILVLLLVASAPAYALGSAPISAQNITSNTPDQTLSAMFHHEQVWLTQQQGSIGDAKVKLMDDAFVHMINGHQAFAKQIALHKAAFEYDISRAKVSLDNARSLLDSHNGFDMDGSIIDRNAAIATLKNANAYLTRARYWIKSAKNELTLARKFR